MMRVQVLITKMSSRSYTSLTKDELVSRRSKDGCGRTCVMKMADSGNVRARTRRGDGYTRGRVMVTQEEG